MGQKIALIGQGKMGQAVFACAEKRGDQILSVITRDTQWNEEILREADIWIDFSHPTTVLETIDRVSHLGGNLVTGTTGWYDHLPQAKKWVEERGTALLYSPNFSLGVHLLFSLIKQAATILKQRPEYQVAISEIHDAQKVDAPAGTAQTLSQSIQEWAELSTPPPITHLRLGSHMPTNTVLFDSPYDNITVTHTAKNRTGFAEGALTAADWLVGRKGIFTMEDVFSS